MNRILAIDTSTKMQALALVEGHAPVARRLTRVTTNHSTTLLANIDDMLTQARWSADDLDGVAVGLGPGTFTGLRVGLATGKAIARSTGAALVGVDSLAAVANPVTSLFSGPVVAVVDARRGEVYCGWFRREDDDLATMTPAHATTAEDVVARIIEADEPVVIVGNGLRAHPEAFAALDQTMVRRLPEPWDGPSSVSIAFLGRRLVEARGPDDIAGLEPNYIRVSDAELNFGPPDATRSVLK